SASSSINFQIPPISIKLDRDNYSLWRATIISSLEAFNLEPHVFAPNPPSATRFVTSAAGDATEEPNPAFTTWKQRDRFILLWLRSTLSERALSVVVRATTAHMAWQTIDRSFQAQTRARRMQLKLQLQSLSKGSLSMFEYLEKKRAIADSLAADQQPISDEDLIGYILTGLDSSYDAFVTAFMMKVDDVTIDQLVGLLLQEEARHDHSVAKTGALLPTPPQPHQPLSAPPPVAAFQMQRQSRSASHHRSLPRRSTAPANNSSPRYGSPRSKLFCQLCRTTRHEALDCWERTNLSAYPSRGPPPPASRYQAQQQAQHQAHSTQLAGSPTVMDPSWYFDTGASDHVTPDFTKLTVADAYSGNDTLQVGNEHAGSTSSQRGRQ
ncbi:Retrovirus-related Pol polyprotein from transposon RE1, partial [Linum grandiflorum]